MILEITKEYFEHCVPAFETSDDQIFTRLQSFFDNEICVLGAMIGDDANKYFQAHSDLEDLAKRYVCVRAARLAIPQLDLVLTQTGFGVVSTNNVAPASRDRVNALVEHLRKSESLTHDILFSDLMRDTDWRDTPYCRRMVNSLLWSASAVRGYGVTLDGKTVYQEEMEALRPKIDDAEAALTDFISDELYQAFVRALAKPYSQLPEQYLYVRDLCVKYLCCHIMGQSGLSVLQNKIQMYLDKYANEFPEYEASDIYKANHVKRFKNEKGNKFHFW